MCRRNLQLHMHDTQHLPCIQFKRVLNNNNDRNGGNDAGRGGLRKTAKTALPGKPAVTQLQ